MAVRRINRRCIRVRIGRVSMYLHHGAWWVYYREGDKQIRRRVGVDRAVAERVAAEVNVQVVFAAPTMFAFKPVHVNELCTRFLQHHEQVSRSAVSTIIRYRAATQHLVDYVTSLGRDLKAHEISASGFVNFLRLRQVSPNGHANASKRRLRDKGVQFILEVCRSMFTFAQRQRCLPPYATNPFAELRLDRMRIEDAKAIFVFDAISESQFLRAAREREFPVHFTLAKTGMRPGELCHLMIEHSILSRSGCASATSRSLGGQSRLATNETCHSLGNCVKSCAEWLAIELPAWCSAGLALLALTPSVPLPMCDSSSRS